MQIPRKRIKDKDANVIVTVVVSKSATTTDAKAVGPTNNKVETMEYNGNIQTRQLLLDRNSGSQD